MNLADRLPLAALGLLALLWSTSPLRARAHVEPAALAPDRPLASLAPPESLVYVELARAGEILEPGLEHPLARTILGSPLGDALEGAWGKSPEQALAELDTVIGYEVLPTLARVGSRGAALSVGLKRAKPVWLIFLHGEDADLLEETLEQALSFAANAAGFPGALDAPSAHRDGADLWQVGEGLRIARRGALAVFGNDADAIDAVLARAADTRGPEKDGLLASKRFGAAFERRDGEEHLWGWLDLERARELQRAGGEKQGLIEFAAAAAKPPVQLLLGPGLAALGRADTMTLAATLRGEDLELELDGLGVDAGAAASLLPPDGAASDVALPRAGDNLAEAVVYRDFAGIFRERVELFAPEVQPKFAEAESVLSLFFGGADLTESVLPHLGPWVVAVARPVAFDERAVPDVPLPGLALLAEVDDPAGIGEELVAAFQTAIGLANVDRAQKRLDSLRLGLRDVNGVTLTTARFRPPNPEDGVDMRFNLEPATALVGRTWILGTHAALVEELVRELQAEGPTRAARADGAGELLRLSGADVAQVIGANRELLVMNGVLEDGKPRAQAESEIDGLHTVAQLVDSLELRVHYPGEGHVRLGARLDLVEAGRGR